MRMQEKAKGSSLTDIPLVHYETTPSNCEALTNKLRPAFITMGDPFVQSEVTRLSKMQPAELRTTGFRSFKYYKYPLGCKSVVRNPKFVFGSAKSIVFVTSYVRHTYDTF